MARKQDSGWRDGLLGTFHSRHGVECPAPGMTLPMLEYDRGRPVALIAYLRQDTPLPSGAAASAAYQAFSNLYNERDEYLPLFTIRYDPRNWSFLVYGHNAATQRYLNTQNWQPMTERQLVTLLYSLRGRQRPDLEPYGVNLADNRWNPELSGECPDEMWPGQLMSERRRNYEPAGQVRAAWRNPCVDVDLAIVGGGQVNLLVDYKTESARFDPTSTNMHALSGLNTAAGQPVPALVVRYVPGRPGWMFHAYPLGAAGRHFLAFALGHIGADVALAEVIAGGNWVTLTRAKWLNVLEVARGM